MSMSCSMMSTVMAGSSRCSRSAMRCDSAGEWPAVGSSRSRPGGRPASASAISSCRCSPWERLRTTAAARSASPTAASASRARSSSAWYAASGRSIENLTGVRAWTASRQFSSTVRVGKRLVIWNVRASPSAARRCGATRVTSRSKRRMAPDVTGSSPEMRLKSVVLPAPLGPMSARRSPGRTASATPSTARSPPNAFETASSLRASSPTGSLRAGFERGIRAVRAPALPAQSCPGGRFRKGGEAPLRGLTVLARRVGARVKRPLPKLLGAVFPELADRREGRDDGVLQLAAHLLHLPDIDVLDRVAPRVDLHRSAGEVLEVHLAQRGQERLAILDLAADGLDRLHDPPGVGVARLGVVRGDLAGLGLEALGELLVHRLVEGRRVVERADGAERLVAHLGQHRLVDRGAVGKQRHARLQAGVLVLLDELQRQLPEEDGEDGVGVPLDLSQERREVVGVQRRPDLLDDLPAILLEGLLEPADGFPSEGVVGADGGDLAVLRVLVDPVTEDVHGLARVPSRSHDPLGGLALREVVGGQQPG